LYFFEQPRMKLTMTVRAEHYAFIELFFNFSHPRVYPFSDIPKSLSDELT